MKKNICIVSSALPDICVARLSEDFEVVRLERDTEIAIAVSHHPDMILSLIGDSAVFPAEYIKKNEQSVNYICNSGALTAIASHAKRGEKYPLDVSLNALIGDDFILTRVESTSSELVLEATKLGRRIINTNQGYAGCSCIYTPRCVITSDKGIYAALSREGINSIFVSNDGIILDGYDVGFIGGCGGYFCDTLYFFGNIDLLPDGEKIRNFARESGYTIVCISDGPLTDFGGMKFIVRK